MNCHNSPIRRALLGFFSLLIIGILAAEPASAQRISLGPHLGASISPANTFAGISARFGGGMLQFAPDFEASFTDGFDHWQIDANLLYRFYMEDSNMRPYFGAGPVVADTPGNDPRFGANVVAGVTVGFGPVQPFAQSRLTIVDRTSVSAMVGLLFVFPDRRQ